MQPPVYRYASPLLCLYTHHFTFLPLLVKLNASFLRALQSKGMLFGVFDGHGGWACAQAVSKRLLYYIAVAMMPKKSLEELEKCMEHGRPVPPILQWYKHHADFNYRESASLYIDHLRVFWQELLDIEEHGEGMR